jgi:hypothetical protein
LVYSVLDVNGCTFTDNKIISVVSPPVLDIGPNLVLCVGSDVFDLDLESSLLGGSWNGNGVVANRFNPSVAGIGTHTITYVFDDGAGCVSTASKQVVVREDPIVDAGVDLSFCLADGAYDLMNDVSEQGGFWTGSGIVNGNTFSPALSGSGSFVITYNYTDGFGCLATDSKNVNVNRNPTVDAGPTTTICSTSSGIDLNASAFPSGGSWVGAGIVNDVFDPRIVGEGLYDIVYNYTDGNGCVTSDTRTFRVEDPPLVDAGPNRVICLNSPSLALDNSV